MKKITLSLLFGLFLLSSCSKIATVTQVASGTYADGRAILSINGTSKTYGVINLYVKSTKIKVGDMVKVRNNKIIKILPRSKN